jgi:predicted nucleic-acid-binding protein
MRAVDTNVLLRILVRDDSKQAARADAYIVPGAWVSMIVLTEAVWVMSSIMRLDVAAVVRAIEMTLDHEQLTVEDAETVAAALAQFRRHPSLGFSDCLVLEAARKAGHLPLGTFDRGLSRVDGTHRI